MYNRKEAIPRIIKRMDFKSFTLFSLSQFTDMDFKLCHTTALKDTSVALSLLTVRHGLVAIIGLDNEKLPNLWLLNTATGSLLIGSLCLSAHTATTVFARYDADRDSIFMTLNNSDKSRVIKVKSVSTGPMVQWTVMTDAEAYVWPVSVGCIAILNDRMILFDDDTGEPMAGATITRNIHVMIRVALSKDLRDPFFEQTDGRSGKNGLHPVFASLVWRDEDMKHFIHNKIYCAEMTGRSVRRSRFGIVVDINRLRADYIQQVTPKYGETEGLSMPAVIGDRRVFIGHTNGVFAVYSTDVDRWSPKRLDLTLPPATLASAVVTSENGDLLALTTGRGGCGVCTFRPPPRQESNLPRSNWKALLDK